MLNKQTILEKLDRLAMIAEIQDRVDGQDLSDEDIEELSQSIEQYDEEGNFIGPRFVLRLGDDIPVLSYDDEGEFNFDMFNDFKGKVEALSDDEIEIELEDGNTVVVDKDTLFELIEDPELFYTSLSNIDVFINTFDIEEDIIDIKEAFSNVLGNWVHNLFEASSYTKNRKKIGRKIIRNRIINGKTQFRINRSGAKGYKIIKGHAVRMTPTERRSRRLGARIAKRKRKTKMATILRKRARSMRIRKSRLGS